MCEATAWTPAWLFCFDTVCQLAYMIYIKKANARIYILRLKHNSRLHSARQFIGVLQYAPKKKVGWEGVEFGQLILRKIIKNIVIRCQI